MTLAIVRGDGYATVDAGANHGAPLEIRAGSLVRQAAPTGNGSRSFFPVIPQWQEGPTLAGPPDPNCIVTSIQNMASRPSNPYPKDFPGAPFDVSIGYPPVSATPTANGGPAGVPQIYVDSSCLSCLPAPGSGALSPGLYKNGARLSPLNDWIVFTGEMASHPSIVSSPANQQYMMFNGWWSDLWVVRPDGSHWYNLTNLIASSSFTSPVGTLAPQLSPDESKVAWASLAGVDTTATPIGVFRLMIADFVVDASGVASLRNVRDISAPNGNWFEPTSWSPDGTKLVLSADIGLPFEYGADDFVFDLATNTYHDVTNQPMYWEEHAYFSPHGNKIIHESEYPNPGRLPGEATLAYEQWRADLKTELYVMNVDGSQPMQLTGANVPAPPGTPDPELNLAQSSTVSSDLWNTSGTQVLMPQATIDPSTGKVNSVTGWLITFVGQCG